MNFDKLFLEKREQEFKKRRECKIIETYQKKYGNELRINGEIELLYKLGILDELYDINKSITQSFRASTGKDFEKILKEIFDKNQISYGYQIPISNDGIILSKGNKNCHKLDFIIPKPFSGDHVKNYEIISCKSSVRERFLQDKFLGKFTIITLDDIKQDLDIKWIKVDEKEQNLTKYINELCRFNLITKNEKSFLDIILDNFKRQFTETLCLEIKNVEKEKIEKVIEQVFNKLIKQ